MAIERSHRTKRSWESISCASLLEVPLMAWLPSATRDFDPSHFATAEVIFASSEIQWRPANLCVNRTLTCARPRAAVKWKRFRG